MEVWKQVKGYDGIYEVSNLGNVRSLDRIIKWRGCFIVKKGIILKTKINRGYPFLGLNKDNVHKNKYIHRLVAEAFIPNPENKPQVNHINGIKTDNRVENLEWCTRSENQLHAVENKLNIAPRGEKHYMAKLTEKDVLEIRKSILNSYELAKIYNVSHQTISRAKNRQYWKHI